MTKTYRICPFCEATCGLELDVDHDARTLLSVKPNHSDHLSQGHICPKAVALKDLDEDPDRLRVPLIRRGGNLQEATWEEAFAEIKKRALPIIEKHSRHAAGIYIGNPTAHKPGLAQAFPVFARALGTPNMFSASTLDQMPRHVASGLLYGSWMTVPIPDIDRTDLLVVVGANPMVSNGSLWTVPGFRERLRKMKARGGKLIVVDPKRTATAKEADQHLSIRPGTDIFFFLSILATLFDEGLADPKHARDIVENMDTLSEAVRPYTPEATESVTSISADSVRELARQIAETEKASLYTRIGTSVSEFGTTATWAADLINILTGHLDREGGAMWPKTAAFQYNASGPGGSGKGVRSGRRKSRVRGAPEVMGEFPAVCLSEEIETPGEGQIRLLFTIAGNPALSAPGGARLARALDTLDFMVSTDIYLNETTRHADVILPGASQLEEFHFPISFQQFSARNVVRYTPATFPLAKGRPAEWEIMYRLALIMSGQDDTITPADLDDMIIAGRVKSAIAATPELEGRAEADILSELAPRKGPERVIDLELRTGPFGDKFGAIPDGLNLTRLADNPGGIDLGALAPRLPEVLRTPNGTINLLPQEIAEDLPRVAESLDTMKKGSGTALLMIGRRNVRTNNSWMHNLPVLAKGRFKGALEIHPEDATPRGLESGSVAIISNDRGKVEVEVDVTDDVAPGVVCLPHGFGHVFDDTNLSVAGQSPGANSNLLASTERTDPLSGNAVLNGIEVNVAARV